MATPAFLAQDDSTVSPIRYYTALDPYFYTVDNRPIQDIAAIVKDARSGGGDAARRSGVISNIASSLTNAKNIGPFGGSIGVTGLAVNTITNSVVRIMPGAVYQTRNLSSVDAAAVVKQAILAKSIDFSVTYPSTPGTSLVYTVEGEFVELDSLTLPSSTIPYVDTTNQYLPSSTIIGELKLTIVAGTPASTGSETPASTTSGKFPLYNITLDMGASAFRVAGHANAPYREGLSYRSTPVPLLTNGATIAEVNEVASYTFVKASLKSVTLPVSLSDIRINPYKSIKIKINFTSTVASGVVAFRTRYKSMAEGDLTSIISTISTTDTASASATIGAVKEFTTVNASIPPSVFAGFVNGVWTINKKHLNVILERVSLDSLDTNTGDVSVLDTYLFQ